MVRPGQMLRQPPTHRRPLRRLNAATETRRQASLPQRLCACAASTALFCRHASTLQKHTQGQYGMHHTPVPHKALQLIGSDMLRQMSEVLLNLQHAECRRGGG